MPTTSLNVPLLPQRSRADCLPVCVEMVLTFFGQTVNPTWLDRVLETRCNIGTPGFKVLNLQKHGYDVTYTSATDERVLAQSLAHPLPSFSPQICPIGIAKRLMRLLLC